MDRFGLKWTEQVEVKRSRLNGLNWIEWTKVDRFRLKWTEWQNVEKNGLNGPNWTEWTEVDQNNEIGH